MDKVVALTCVIVALAAAGQDPNLRVIGGREITDITEIPFQVALSTYPTKLNETFCDGALISDKFVLTAASCFENVVSPRYVVIIQFGAANLKDTKVVRIATKVHKHLKWNSETRKNDIAIVEFRPIALTYQIRPIRLPSLKQENELFEVRATVSGRGLETDKDDLTRKRVLRSGQTQVISNSDCIKGQSEYNVTNTNICTTTVKDDAQICSGDEGSPLYIVDSDNIKTLIGLGSFKDEDCEVQDKPSVFTRVSKYLIWINGVTSIPIRPE